MKLQDAYILYSPKSGCNADYLVMVVDREGLMRHRLDYEREFMPADLDGDLNRLLIAYISMSMSIPSDIIHEAFCEIEEYCDWFIKHDAFLCNKSVKYKKGEIR